jgi:hypothetical protein
MSVNHDLKVRGLDFDTPEFLEWKPEDPLDCDVWAHVEVGDERGGVLFQLHICTAESMKRIENKRYCFVIDQFVGKTDLIACLDSFIAEKTKGCTGDPYWALAKFWRCEYGKYDKRGQFIG